MDLSDDAVVNVRLETNSPSEISSLIEQCWNGVDELEGLKMCDNLTETILTVLVSMKTGVYSRATSRTRSGTRVCHVEPYTLGCESIDMRSSHGFATVRTQVFAQVVGNKKEDILPGTHYRML
jgi:hypothetical protein